DEIARNRSPSDGDPAPDRFDGPREKRRRFERQERPERLAPRPREKLHTGRVEPGRMALQYLRALVERQVVLDDLPERLERRDVMPLPTGFHDAHDAVVASPQLLALAPVVGAALPGHAFDAVPELGDAPIRVDAPLVGR